MDARKTILKLFIFILPLAVAWAFIEYKLAQIPNTYNQKRRYLEQQLDSIQVLALGTSHIQHGVDPSYFSLYGFNLANSNQSIYYNKRLALKYVDKMSRLRMVVIEVGYFSLYYQIINDKKEYWRDYFYSQCWGIHYKDLPLWDMRRYSKIALYTPAKVKEYAAHNFNEDLTNGLTHNGFMPRKPDEHSMAVQLEMENVTTRIAGLNKLIDTTLYSSIYDDLDGLVNDLTIRKIEVVFITTPWIPDLYRISRKDIFEKNSTAVNALCTKYHCGYFNYLQDPRFTKTDFADPNHLNPGGAKKFSTIINDEIILPVMKK